MPRSRNINVSFLIVLLLFAGQANGQFSTVINIPPEPNIGLGGRIDDNTQLNLGSGGSIGDYFTAQDGIDPETGVEINVSGGTIGSNMRLERWGTLNLSGGTIGDDFEADYFTTINVSSGSIGDRLIQDSGSINTTGGSIGNDMLLLDATSINIAGTSIGNNADLRSSNPIRIAGSHMGENFSSYTPSKIEFSGTTLGPNSQLKGEHNYITSGSIGDNFETGNYTYISGGTIGDNFDAGSTVHLSGGTIGANFIEGSGGLHLHLYGSQFILDSVDITDTLPVNVTTHLGARDVVLEGMLADKSPFSFFLLGHFGPSQSEDSIPQPEHNLPLNTLTITKVLPGDFNGNRFVEGLDFLRWQRGMGTSFTVDDFNNWETNFGMTPPSIATTIVPEPSTALLILTSLAITIASRRSVAKCV